MNMSMNTNLTPAISQNSPAREAGRPGVAPERPSESHSAHQGTDGPAMVYTASTDPPSAGTYNASGTLNSPDAGASASASASQGSSGMQGMEHGSGCNGG